MLWILDLDGVVWLAGQAIAGSSEAVGRLRQAGEDVVFVTNNAGPTVAEHTDALRAAGVAAEPSDVVTSAQAAASLLDPGASAAVVGGAGIHEALVDRGVTVVAADARPDAVVIGRAPALDYDELSAAASALRDGARFVATNTDATFPSRHGLLPGAGAVVAFLSVASGIDPEIAGKPNRAIAEVVRLRFGEVGMAVGDRIDTDGRFAALIGAPFALVLTGVTDRAEIPADYPPGMVSADLATVVDNVLSGRHPGAC